MYKNKYLEECLQIKKGNHKLLRSYINTKENNFNTLVINDLGFMYSETKELEDFKKELIKANVKSFILTASSSALMDYLHALDSVNVKIKEVKKVVYIDKWDKKEYFKKGLEMIVK